MNWQKQLWTVSALALISTSVWAEKWNQANDPALMGPAMHGQAMEMSFKNLPLSARLPEIPWSDDYWPTYKGGITKRFMKSERQQVISLADLKTREQLKQMSASEIAELSPAEKLDILNGDYNYTLTKHEFARTADRVRNPKGNEWEGLCHGWASAAYNYSEPDCKDLTNPDGIKISFGSSDTKALVTFFQGQVCEEPSCGAGERCNLKAANPITYAREDFKDINAGSFHLILANLIGKVQQGFVMDRTTDAEVWNQPIFGFKTKVLKNERYRRGLLDRKNPIDRVLTVETTVDWIAEIGASDQPYNGRTDEMLAQSKYVYKLELDKAGKIIGGEWVGASKTQHPDFVWHQGPGDLGSHQIFARVKELIKK